MHCELEDNGVFVQSRGKRTLKEEMPEIHKDISRVVSVGIKPVWHARLPR
ncbi:MAG: hypothetical protein JRD04_04210 [Deltaproteobacteria bacterium]|nr:hypothetical protein [Deltaproteobacteria bacterium]